MKNALRVVKRDFLRLLKAPAALTVVAVLVILPSLYTWFNVAGFWNPYDNTGNLRVCVVNEDQGASTEITGAIDLGGQVVDQLESDHQLGWDFTDYNTAMEAVKSGKAYAAFVIPSDFSQDVTTLLTGDFKQPKLQYYVNEKAGAIPPKITDAGATTLDETINSTFVSTVSGVVADQVDKSLADANSDIDASKTSVAAQLGKAQESVQQARTTVSDLSAATDDMTAKASGAKDDLGAVRSDVDNLSQQLSEASDLMLTTQNALSSFSTSMGSALDKSSALTSSVATKTNTAVGKANDAVVGAGASVKQVVDAGTTATTQNQAVIDLLQQLVDSGSLSDSARQQAQAVIDQLKAQNDSLKQAVDGAQKTYDDLSQASQDIASASDQVNSAVQGSLSAADGYRDALSTQTFPAINGGVSNLAAATANLSTAVSNQQLLIDQTSTALDQLISALGSTKDALGQTDSLLSSFEGGIGTVQTDLEALNVSGALADLLGTDGKIDPSKIADFMMSPTELEPEKLYEVNAYGSAMAPLFMNMTLWIGVFMLLVILRQEVDGEGIPQLSAGSRFIGRWLFLAPLTCLQAIVCCTGVLALGAQVASLPLFYLTAMCASLTYLSIQYTLAILLQHIGKGLCIVLIFMQIPGATGLYPIEMTPAFFQTVYPLFPFTYGINALRETIAGFYGNAWIECIGVMLAFLVVFFLVGLKLRPYMTNVNRMFAKQIKSAGIVNGEDLDLPPRRYRLDRLLTLLANREEFREQLDYSVGRFWRWYPHAKRFFPAVAIGVPVIVTLILALVGVEKVIVLTAWLAWLLLCLLSAVIVEYVRDKFEHELSLDDLSDDDVRLVIKSHDGVSEAPAPLPSSLKRGVK